MTPDTKRHEKEIADENADTPDREEIDVPVPRHGHLGAKALSERVGIDRLCAAVEKRHDVVEKEETLRLLGAARRGGDEVVEDLLLHLVLKSTHFSFGCWRIQLPWIF
jgi:hypothetical protein